MRAFRSFALIAVLAGLSGPVLAGGFAAPMVEGPVVLVEPDAPRSTWGVILPLALLGGLIALAVANSSNDDDDPDA